MRFVIALVLILLVVPVAAARADTDPSEKVPTATLAETGAETAEAETLAGEVEPLQPEMLVGEVEIPSQERASAEATATQDMPRRGSFWWLVGVIVVAGVILAVLVS